MGELTVIEHRLGRLLRQGLTNKQIGAALGYSPGHVRNRLGRMMQKTETDNRVHLAVTLERWECQGSVQTR